MAQMDIALYMQNRCWETDQKLERKRYLCQLARKSKKSPDISQKIGGMLIYNQVIEEYMKDIVSLSICYVKAEIWPAAMGIDPDTESATMGKLIDYFRQYALQAPNLDRILTLLKKFNVKRNQVVHDLFDIPDLDALSKDLNHYISLAQNLIRLLDEYDDHIINLFRELEKQNKFPAATK